MRIAYLGTSEFAAGVLRRLAASPHAPVLVVTRPDRPAGRGRKLQSPPVADAARELGLDLIQPEQVNDDPAVLAPGPEALVVCAFGALIREPLLSAREILNVHPSLLPRWRGAAPIERAIMAGDAATGVAIMRLTAGLDAGPVCAVEEVAIGPRDDYGTLSARLEEVGARLLIGALDGAPEFADQDESAVTYAEKITAADRELDGTEATAAELDRVVRALHPHIGARAGDLRVLEARPCAAGPPPGEMAEDEGRLLLGTRDGALELVRVQPPGKRPMNAADYLRGRR